MRPKIAVGYGAAVAGRAVKKLKQKDHSQQYCQPHRYIFIKGIQQFLDDKVEVIDQKASIRPTVSDRRPIIGPHPIYKNLICLNGMGTRGTMLAPAMVDELFNHLENGTEIDKEADISRFYHLLTNEL